MTRERQLLEQLVKSWAQAHTTDFQIADYEQTDKALTLTEGHLTYVVRNNNINLDLFDLVNRVEVYLDNKRKRKFPDGMICRKCQAFYDFAEPNQSDGSMVCYTCRTNPYR
jgi:hypothetical protein